MLLLSWLSLDVIMNRFWEPRLVSEFFTIKSGDFHATKDLDSGHVPLVSCGFENNGVIGYFDIPDTKTYQHAITVAYNGSWPLMSKFHPYPFGAKDDVAILQPRAEMADDTMLFVAAALTRMSWRYSYGRKCYREKLESVRIQVPLVQHDEDGGVLIDEEFIRAAYPSDYRSMYPQQSGNVRQEHQPLQWQRFGVEELFSIRRGDFHSLSELSAGPFPTVSRVSTGNGIVGYYERPDEARIYPSGVITVSTVSGDAFVQHKSFIATDNVLICEPRRSYRPSTLFFIAYMLTRQKWRYSYGRQCYVAKFRSTRLYLPVNASGELAEDAIESRVSEATYWNAIKGAISPAI